MDKLISIQRFKLTCTATCIQWAFWLVLVLNQPFYTSCIWTSQKSSFLSFIYYSKTCLKRPLKKKTKLVFKTDYRLIWVGSIAECSKGSILQYFRPSLSYHLSFMSLLCLLLSSRLRQVLLYKWFLTLKAPITTAAGDKFCDIFPSFRQK